MSTNEKVIIGYRLKGRSKVYLSDPTSGECVEGPKDAHLFKSADEAIKNKLDNNWCCTTRLVRVMGPAKYGVWAIPNANGSKYRKADWASTTPRTKTQAEAEARAYGASNLFWDYSARPLDALPPAEEKWCIRKTHVATYPSKDAAEKAIRDNAAGFFHGGLAAWHAAPLK